MGYPSDVSAEDWEKIKEFFARPDPRGKRAKYDVRLIVNAIFSFTKAGCHWRYLPQDFPPWWLVYKRFERWNNRGVWEQVLEALTRRARLRQGRAVCPSYALIDTNRSRLSMPAKNAGLTEEKK
jgi:putative transposase